MNERLVSTSSFGPANVAFVRGIFHHSAPAVGDQNASFADRPLNGGFR
jgi:hypothetical protein